MDFRKAIDETTDITKMEMTRITSQLTRKFGLNITDRELTETFLGMAVEGYANRMGILFMESKIANKEVLSKEEVMGANRQMISVVTRTLLKMNGHPASLEHFETNMVDGYRFIGITEYLQYEFAKLTKFFAVDYQ